MDEKIQRVIYQIKEISSSDLYELIKTWHDTLKYERASSLHTIYNYLLDVKEFFSFLKEYSGSIPKISDLSELDLSGFRSFLAHRIRNHKSPQSNKRLLSSLRNLYLFIQKKTGVKSAYIDEITSPKTQKRLPKTIPFQQVKVLDDLSQIYANKPKWILARDEALLILLYGCGLRISEALNLNLSDLNNEVLRIKGKRNKERIVPILPLVVNKINKYLEIRPGGKEREAPLFIGVRGDRLNPRGAQKVMENIRLAYQLPESATPHSLRHSYASHLLAGGADLRSIQELLGHDSLASTQVYTKLEDQALIDIYMKSHPRANALK